MNKPTNETTEKLTTWAINKIKTMYPEDVALLVAVHGHNVDGDGHGECFDYFVPATEKGNELAQTFIIGDVGHDLYPRSWERTERTAALDDWATLCLGDGEILYSRTKEDEKRFYVLQKKLTENLMDKTFVYKKALENLDVAMGLYRTMMFEEKLYQVRMAAAYICDYLSIAVMHLNGTYIRSFGESQISQLQVLSLLPDSFVAYYEAVIHAQSVDELKNLSHLIIRTARRFIATQTPEKTDSVETPNFQDLAGWYEEGSLAWRRIRFYCKTKNVRMAFDNACRLQNELSIIQEEFVLKELDLVGVFNAEDLNPLLQRASELEKYIIYEIEAHGVDIRHYDTLEDFLAQNE